MSRRLLPCGEFAAGVNAALRAGTSSVPLLVFRVPEFAERAWVDGRRPARRMERATARAFTDAASRVVREPDVLGHDAGSDWFSIGMLSPSRADAPFAALDARAALERIATAMSSETGRRMEYGWCTIDAPFSERDDFDTVRARALERGTRDRERYEFLATVGHELRTPLTSIRGYIETLLDDAVDTETSRRFLETARREALRLTRLVEGILDFSLLDLHAVQGPIACDVVPVAHAAIDALLPIAADAGVAVVRDELCGSAYARIDRDACMHVVLNLIENAVKYAGRPGKVAVSVKRVDPFIRIAVDDDGRGVSEADRERIFAYGERGTGARHVRGRGVGLAIVKTIVERAGGGVTVGRSTLGGACFRVEFTKAEPLPPS